MLYGRGATLGQWASGGGCRCRGWEDWGSIALEIVHKLHLFDSGVQLSGSSESDQGQYLPLSTLLSDLGCRLTAMRPSMTTGHLF